MLIVTSDVGHLQQLLLDKAIVKETFTSIPAKAPEIGFLVLGQSSQQIAMAKGIGYQHFASLRSDVQRFAGVARSHGFRLILPLVDGRVTIEPLSPTIVLVGNRYDPYGAGSLKDQLQSPLIVCRRPQPRGVCRTSDRQRAWHQRTIYLCGRRSELLKTMCTPEMQGMAAVQASEAQFQQDRVVPDKSGLEVACINSPEGSTVLAGLNDAVNCGSL
ncbi:hypothetical protein N0V93_010329 [Gnomoniopsis smithogilvyi]|uniref:Uncharacterized protein n=1 Tax=Gnomoniopsis smithogilvyi TaxID=1191159 RepID=A0A9W8YHR5_9PEZI|nr:hypothetical protein N0V93_010329 [Gnomoniopsis smithogilvyi]